MSVKENYEVLSICDMTFQKKVFLQVEFFKNYISNVNWVVVGPALAACNSPPPVFRCF